MKRINIEIDYEGKVSVDTEGFTGKSGSAIRDAISEALSHTTKVVPKRKKSKKKTGHPPECGGCPCVSDGRFL